MLTELALKRLNPHEEPYKVADRDGMYAAVSPIVQIAFRYDYRLHGRRETLAFSKCGPGGLSLAEAWERCMIARKLVAEGKSPASVIVTFAKSIHLSENRSSDRGRSSKSARYDRLSNGRASASRAESGSGAKSGHSPPQASVTPLLRAYATLRPNVAALLPV